MTVGIDYVDVSFGDKTGRLRYGVAVLRDLCLALGGLTLVELLTRLAGLDPNASLQSVRYGLLHERPRLTIGQTAELVEAHIQANGDARKLLDAISEALDRTGLVSAQGKADGGSPSPPE